MIHGSTTPGTFPFLLRSGSVIVSDPITLAAPQFLVRVGARLATDGVEVGAAHLRGVLYTEAGVLVADGPVTAVADGETPGLVWFTFEGARGRVLAQGTYRAGLHVGDISSTARIYTDVAAPSPRPAVVVNAAKPAHGPYLWWNLAGAHPVAELIQTGAGTAASAAVFAQPDAPTHAGPFMWIHAPREGEWSPGDPITITFDDSGAGSPTADPDLILSTAGAPAHALHHVDIGNAGGTIVMDVLYAPANEPTTAEPPTRLDVFNHSVTGPLLVETSDLFTIPTNVSDDYLATMPWDLTQRALGSTGPIRGTRMRTNAGWYGRDYGTYRGAQAVARSGSPMVELVGERIRVTRRRHGITAIVYLYVTDEREFDDDIETDLLMSHRAFMTLDNPVLDLIPVTIDVMS